MRKILDAKYNNLAKALYKVGLQIHNNHVERRPNGWTYKIRTFCFPASIQVKIRLGNELIEVMGVSDESPDEAVFDLIEKLKNGIVEVSSSNGKQKKLYRFHEGDSVFNEMLESEIV